jgi:integrase
MRSKRNRTPGIRVRHRRTCSTREGGTCNCQPAFEAFVFSKRDGKKIRRTFERESEAKLWRADALVQLSKGAMRAPKPTTVREAWDAWLTGARAGTVRNRSGERYKPSAIRAYEKAMRLRVLPEFGPVRLADLHRPELQDFTERLIAEKLAASTVQVTLLPLRAIFKRAVNRGELHTDPCTGLSMPTSNARRERFASPTEGEALIAAAPERDRALWATALYAGLRRGELMALRWEDVDLASGLIHVRNGWDPQEGQIDLKSRAGRRKVPIIPALRDFLIDHRLATGRSESFVFGRNADLVFDPRAVTDRADKAWKAASIQRITLHECRHTFASLMIAAGVNAKALSTFMGHANISITLDRYGHLMPGTEAEAAQLLDTYLATQREQAEDSARNASPDAQLVTVAQEC